MSVLNVMVIHLIAEILQSRSKCWVDGASDFTIPGAMQLVWLKTSCPTSANPNSRCKKYPPSQINHFFNRFQTFLLCLAQYLVFLAS